ncbi:hypothetical protein BJX76DRAFT_358782 [Aspergillus varians]
MRVSILSAAAAITLAAPTLARPGSWIIPAAGQTGKVTDPSRIYCIIDDGTLSSSPACTTFTSDGNGGLESEGGWLQVNEDSHEVEIIPGDAPAFRWQGQRRLDGSPAESVSYFTATDEEPLYGPIWNHVPGTDHVAPFTGSGNEAPVVLSFVTVTA